MPRYSDNPRPRWKGGPMLTGGLAFLAAALASVLFSLPAHAETWQVEGLKFDAVIVLGDVDVEISQGDDAELLLRGDQRDIDLHPFILDGDTLVLGSSREARSRDFSGVKFRLITPKLEHLELKGSGDVYVKPFESESLFVSAAGSGTVRLFEIKSDDTTLQLSGSGTIQLAKLLTRELAVSLSGSGDIQLGDVDADIAEVAVRGSGDITLESGYRVDEVEISIVGSGDVDFRHMDAGHAEINIVGSGDVRIGEIEVLEVNILGSGDVVYRGDPEIDQDVLIGSGDLRRER
ncbi:DUF2807 domain-containing protein [Parahaliea maris]|uniref:DUF2807 domain-containing protein n=1 Tax=Parahaliea maris TaxID=2716870 RepID=A0A5C9A3D6_9GAMM|nr:DUF2807 domain-containing protein [Parahaliea maris]TXS95226.1 DUF2807 domain-containing protein [Parahaliea maris]